MNKKHKLPCLRLDVAGLYHKKKFALPHLTFGNTNLRCCFIWSATHLRQILILFSFEAQISGGTSWWSLINQLIYSIFRPKRLISTGWMCWTSSLLTTSWVASRHSRQDSGSESAIIDKLPPHLYSSPPGASTAQADFTGIRGAYMSQN